MLKSLQLQIVLEKDHDRLGPLTQSDGRRVADAPLAHDNEQPQKRFCHADLVHRRPSRTTISAKRHTTIAVSSLRGFSGCFFV